MIPDPELQAIRQHAAKIEAYEAAREARRRELIAPYEARASQIWQTTHPPELLRPGRRGRMVDIEDMTSDDPTIMEELDGWLEVVNAGLSDFARANRPDVRPYDTPGKLVDWVAGQLAGISLRLTGIDDDGFAEPPRVEPARSAYWAAHYHAMQFVALAPSILDVLAEANDPIIGLQRIWGLFSALDTPGRLSNPTPIFAWQYEILAALGRVTRKSGEPYSDSAKYVLDKLTDAEMLEIKEGDEGDWKEYSFVDRILHAQIQAEITASRQTERRLD